MSNMTKQNGLYQKYTVQKSDGTPIDPNAKYFILRYDKNDDFGKYSRRAIFEFAKWAQRNPEFKQLAEDLLYELAERSSQIYGDMIRAGKMQGFFDGIQ